MANLQAVVAKVQVTVAKLLGVGVVLLWAVARSQMNLFVVAKRWSSSVVGVGEVRDA